MDLQSEKIALIKQLLETDSVEVIESIKAIFANEAANFKTDLPAHIQKSIRQKLQWVNEDAVDSKLVMAEFKARYGINN